MPRLSRTVFAGVPHHITQRGNRREDIFFTDEDHEAYLSWLKEYCEKFGVEILAYCLVNRGYDADNRLVSYPLGGSTRSLAFDDAGRITHINDSNPALLQAMSYDVLDRLTGWATQLYNQGYNYDAGSNRTSATYGTSSFSHSVAPASNRLQSVAGPTPKTYQHDAAGNVIHDGRTSFAYNDRGRLASVSNAQGATSYLVNGLGQRSVKTGSEGIRFVYDEGGKLLGEYDPGGALLQETLYLGDMPVAVIR